MRRLDRCQFSFLVLSFYPSISLRSKGEKNNPGAYNFTTVGVEGLGVTSATLTSLRAYTKYSVVVQAFNSRGAGPSSPPATLRTLEDSKDLYFRQTIKLNCNFFASHFNF